MKNAKRWMALSLAAGMVFGLCVGLSGCRISGQENPNARGNYANGYGTLTELREHKAAENSFCQQVTQDSKRLLLNPATAEIAIEDLKTGIRWYSNPVNRAEDSVATKEGIGRLNSQVMLTYQNPMKQKATFFSGPDSVESGNYAWKQREDGFEVTYHLGKEAIDRDIPKALTVSRFQQLTGKLSASDRTFFTRQYSLLKFEMLTTTEQQHTYLQKYQTLRDQNLYVLRPSNQNTYQKLRKLLQGIFYTSSDLTADHKASGYHDTEENPVFELTVRYQLCKGELQVTVPVKSLVIPAGYTMVSIELLPYFGCEGTGSKGLILLPDGSGSIIRMNNGKSNESPCEIPLYGDDPANYDETKRYALREAHFPVFGICGDNSSLLAIVEGGKENAEIKAAVSGQDSAQNHVYPVFHPVAEESYTIGQEAGAEVSFFDSTLCAADLSVRYLLFAQKESYAGLANAYQKILIGQGLLKKKNSADREAVYLQLTGAVLEQKNICGISYDKPLALTTFARAETILQQFAAKCPQQLVVSLAGWNRKGVGQATANSLQCARVLGGDGGFSALIDACRTYHITLYPQVDWQSTTQQTGLLGTGIARTITGKTGRCADGYRSDLYLPIGLRTVFSPGQYAAFGNKTAELAKKYHLTGVGLGPVGAEIVADYANKSYIPRAKSTTVTTNAMQRLTGQGVDVLTRGVSDWSLPFVEETVELDTGCAEYALTDAAVPFVQLVLSGYLSYAGTAYNLDDPQTNFLKALETGSALYGDFMGSSNASLKNKAGLDGYYTGDYHNWLEPFGKDATRLAACHKALGSRVIVDHQLLTNRVAVTTYAGGGRVVINYSHEPYVFEGTTVAPMDYLVVTGEHA